MSRRPTHRLKSSGDLVHPAGHDPDDLEPVDTAAWKAHRRQWQWAEVRMRRALLLKQSDWSQLPDVPAPLQSAWRSYRQALRDLPATGKDPARLKWPTAPDAKG